MTPAARLSAAIEVLDDIAARRRPAADALKDWGLSHRFAGAKDRAALASLVYDALRRKASAAWLMGFPDLASAPSRAILLGALRLGRGMAVLEIAKLADGSRFALAPLSAAEHASLEAGPETLARAPAAIAGDFPAWLEAPLAAEFGDALIVETQALATRAPLDLRVNTLKGTREDALRALAHLDPALTPHSPLGLRLPHLADGRGPSVQSEPAYLGGLVEIQDEGSQLVSLLAGARPGDTVIDMCAGGGGKTLALAGVMENRGRIVATDADPRRLAPLHARLARSGATIVEIGTPRGRGHEPLAGLEALADLVLVDAPCTGIGTWRRNPDAKWRVRPGSLAQRLKEQDEVLGRAIRFVKPGGRIAYITCALLPDENERRIASFLARHQGFEIVLPGEIVASGPAELGALASHGSRGGEGVLLTPARTGTDGFFLIVLRFA